MPIVAKNSAEYLLKRQQLLNDYADYAKMRKTYKKSADSIRETGTPFFQSMDEPKTTLESYLDKSKIDENLLNLLVANLGAQSGQAKQFIQGLDDNMKVNLLDRFPTFEKIFSKNFITPKLISLIGAFEIFIKEGLYDKKIKNPSAVDVSSWLNSLAPDVIQLVSNIVTNANNKFVPSRMTKTAPRDVNSVLREIAKYVTNFKNDTLGFSSLYNLLERSGLPPTNLPRPKTTDESADTPSQLLSTPISRILTSAPPTPLAPTAPTPAPTIAKTYDEEEAKQTLKLFSKDVLKDYLRQYNIELSQQPDPLMYLDKYDPSVLSDRRKGIYPNLIRALTKRKFDPATKKFLIFSEGGSRSKSVDPVDPRSAAEPEEGKSKELGDPGDLDLPLPPSVPPGLSLGRGMSIVFMR